MKKIEVEATGIETANQPSHEMGGFIYSNAIKFCGEEMGEAIPPIFDASAIPRMSDLEKGDFAGSVRKIGCHITQSISSVSALKNGNEQKGTDTTHLNKRIA